MPSVGKSLLPRHRISDDLNFVRYMMRNYTDIFARPGVGRFSLWVGFCCSLINLNIGDRKIAVILESMTQARMSIFTEMEKRYEGKDTDYFVKLLKHPDYVVRTRATCILVDFGGEDKVGHIAGVLKNDDNALVRHEAAFSLGQMCYSQGIEPLADATLNDSSMFVRHEAAIALGVIGSPQAKETLQQALHDPDRAVYESAVVALANIEFMDGLSHNEKFARLTGG